ARLARTRDEDDAPSDGFDIADLVERGAAGEIDLGTEGADRPEPVAVARLERGLIGDLDADILQPHRINDLADLLVPARLLAIVADCFAHHPVLQEDLH